MEFGFWDLCTPYTEIGISELDEIASHRIASHRSPYSKIMHRVRARPPVNRVSFPGGFPAVRTELNDSRVRVNGADNNAKMNHA